MFGLQKKIDTDEKKIDDLLSRSVSQVFPSYDALKKALMSGKRLRVYIGADATGADLHLGHSTNFILLEKFRRLGHETIILFGDFTARIGDPSDKTAARVRLSTADVQNNLKSWKEQLSKIVSFGGSNPVKIKENSKWLSKISFEELIDLASSFTVQQMIERDMFQKRISDQKPIYLHEFLYPLMQGYDSVVMDVDVEIGGNDQTFNMLTGRILQRKINNKEKFVVSTTLLENPKTGKKLMNKSEGDYVSMRDSADQMFGKIMALSDHVIVQMFIDTTFKPLDQIEVIKSQLAAGTINPRDAKKDLATEIVSIYHGKEKAKQAGDNFERTFSKKEVPENVLEVNADAGQGLADVLSDNKLIDSKSEWRRLIEQGGVSIVEDNQKVSDPNYKIIKPATYRVGKKRFVKIILRLKNK